MNIIISIFEILKKNVKTKIKINVKQIFFSIKLKNIKGNKNLFSEFILFNYAFGKINIERIIIFIYYKL